MCNAFSAVITEAGDIYWQAGIDLKKISMVMEILKNGKMKMVLTFLKSWKRRSNGC